MHPQDIIKDLDSCAFNEAALRIFRHQARNNPVYHQWITALGVQPELVREVGAIPYLPIGFFRNRAVLCSGPAERYFSSSGTTGAAQSRHYITDLNWYRCAARTGFEQVYGPVSEWCLLALLPGYIERPDSSLVFMVQYFMEESRHPDCGFFLDQFDALAERIDRLEWAGQKTLLIGVTHALLDFASRYPRNLSHTRVMETGGMKGRRREVTREEVHAQLKAAFGLQRVDSEYGMTELLSQAYATENGLFTPPPWLRMTTRDVTDPFALLSAGKTGALNAIDLANYHSCSFIATDDLGKILPDGSFEVLGRLDHAEARGCALLVA